MPTLKLWIAFSTPTKAMYANCSNFTGQIDAKKSRKNLNKKLKTNKKSSKLKLSKNGKRNKREKKKSERPTMPKT
jgi:hypothetical protein